MAEPLFRAFPMLDAAIVNAVAEQFASSSGQVDVREARRALEMMLPPGIQPSTPETQELPDSICVVDPMQPLPYGHSNMSPPGTTFSRHIPRSVMCYLQTYCWYWCRLLSSTENHVPARLPDGRCAMKRCCAPLSVTVSRHWPSILLDYALVRSWCMIIVLCKLWEQYCDQLHLVCSATASRRNWLCE